ncbi:DUF4160 domain-containing protein [Afipia broomeae]|uniref:DUF4160 domain-containing protein n=1 Tax=Afipia broomeae TaxID=56946 RepID=UPI000A070353|nr:DUF4160 domain-containing protein [Afipia broomeae]
MTRIEIKIDGELHDDLSEEIFWNDYRPPSEEFKNAQLHIVARVDGLRIKIWADEHLPPHFHVSYQGEDASFTITDCVRLQGVRGLERYDHLIFSWWLKNKDALVEVWNSSRPSDCPVGPV